VCMFVVMCVLDFCLNVCMLNQSRQTLWARWSYRIQGVLCKLMVALIALKAYHASRGPGILQGQNTRTSFLWRRTKTWLRQSGSLRSSSVPSRATS
jgi:hypothetical protein